MRRSVRRTVSKLLIDSYSRLCASADGYITDSLYDAWEATSSGEAVICEAFVALEYAARDITRNRRTRFTDVETDDPDSIRDLFKRAIERTETRNLSKELIL